MKTFTEYILEAIVKGKLKQYISHGKALNSLDDYKEYMLNIMKHNKYICYLIENNKNLKQVNLILLAYANSPKDMYAKINEKYNTSFNTDEVIPSYFKKTDNNTKQIDSWVKKKMNNVNINMTDNDIAIVFNELNDVYIKFIDNHLSDTCKIYIA